MVRPLRSILFLWASLPSGDNDQRRRTIDKPDPLSNCSVSHQSSESLQIGCNEGFSGGLPQNFLLEIFAIDVVAANTAGSQETASLRPSSSLPELKTNQTSMKPVFIVRGLDPDTAYMAHVTAVNAKGRSEPFAVRIVTLRPPETQKNIGPGKSEGWFDPIYLRLLLRYSVAVCVFYFFVFLLGYFVFVGRLGKLTCRHVIMPLASDDGLIKQYYS